MKSHRVGRCFLAGLIVLPLAQGCASAQKNSSIKRPSQMASSKNSLQKQPLAQKSAKPKYDGTGIRQASAVGMRNEKAPTSELP